ncbi:hypothetical protein N7457_004630 [Penicillium paradoxum]|uniref:uncharacterized protein n=1 Tax=Penicillium paradoxum TaxID=176176 RepID=UPI002548C848|nr:uncharacterized protein N7457_004630 [Penicillium paradoxum]KAJ5782856.1 hypothetical protein N7457_004630 [Penicillium paradoxum]
MLAQAPDPLMDSRKIIGKVTLQDIPIQDIGHEINESYSLDIASHMRNRRPSISVAHCHADSPDEESGSPTRSKQGIPSELPTFTAELLLIFVCSASLMLFSFLLGDMLAPQEQIKKALGITNTELPWVVGAFNTANGLSVIISGSLTDLMPPKLLMVGAFAWLAVWNVIGAFTLHPSRYVLFFITRAM